MKTFLGVRLTPLTVINSNGTTATNTQQPPKAQQPVGTTASNSSTIPVTGNLYINKTVQSIIQKYTIECKSKFDELTKIILKLNLCRKELREYDKQFKSTTSNNSNFLGNNSSAAASTSVTRKNSTAYSLLASDQSTNAALNAQFSRLQSQLFSLTSSSFLLSKANLPKNSCFGCASASIDNCITLFRALLCANNLTPSNTSSNPTQQSSTNNAGSLLLLNYVKSELCRQGILEELIYFSLKRNNNLLNNVPLLGQTPAPGASNVASTTTTTTTAAPATGTSASASSNQPQTQPTTTSTTTNQNALSQQQQLQQRRLFDHDIINLIYLLIKDNPEGSFRFQKLIMEKIDMYLAPISSVIHSNNNNDSIISSLSQLSVNNVSHSPIKSEMMLLSSLMTKQEDSCWEMRLRLVIHILLRSLNVASVSSPLPSQANTKQRLSNPVIIESLTLPCLRILNHVCKTTTNMALLSQIATGSGSGTTNKNSPTVSGLSKPTLPARQSLFMASPANIANNNNTTTPLNVLNRFSSEPVETNYIQLQNLANINVMNSNYLANIPKLDELDPNEFLQSKYFNS